jgi:hypothetical protein
VLREPLPAPALGEPQIATRVGAFVMQAWRGGAPRTSPMRRLRRAYEWSEDSSTRWETLGPSGERQRSNPSPKRPPPGCFGDGSGDWSGCDSGPFFGSRIKSLTPVLLGFAAGVRGVAGSTTASGPQRPRGADLAALVCVLTSNALDR